MISKFIINSIFKHSPEIDAIAWGGRIHTRPGYVLPGPLKAHEEIHLIQQEHFGKYRWILKYWRNSDFRMSQEIPAHKAQIAAGADLHNVAFNFAHNYSFGISYAEAVKLLS